MQGMHWRMGDVWIPDRACTITEIKEVMKVLEEDWATYMPILDYQYLQKTALTMALVVAGFLGP